ncbi:HlyD family secretion protein [Bradyrhizobium lablabi]|nr:HlyD family secretion protein [Bradyrhizobium lablabi]
MNIADHPREQEATTRRRVGGPDDAGVGPQGTALILELQRLRQAFERENLDEVPRQPSRRPAREDPRPAVRPPRAARPKPPKGKISRVLDACLAPLGFHSDGNPSHENRSDESRSHGSPSRASQSHVRREPPMESPSPAAREPAAANPPRVRGPIIAPDDPSLLAMPKPAMVSAASHERPPLHVEAPSLAPSSATDKAATESRSTRALEKCRRGLVAGAAFLINRDGAAEDVPGEGIVQRAGRAFEIELRTGLRALLVIGILAGGWMTLMPLAGAVVVPGNLVVQSNVKTIQHPTGGVVEEIPVHNGMRVRSGDLLLRLNATQAKASLQVVSKQLDEARARVARLTAERDGLPRPAVPAELSGRLDDSNVKTLLASEASLFRARATARDSQKDLLQSRVSQLGEEIGGLEAQVASKARQIELITGELSGVQELYDKHLVPLTRLTTLQRESARIEGERGQLTSSIAETKAKIGEAQLQIVKLDQDFRTDVVKELGEAQGKEAELSERGVAARDVLERIELRAPTSGVIHQLAAHTLGGVIRAGDAIMEIVPDSDDLQIEARLQPNDIDQVRTGQQAYVRFSAFNQRTTPQIAGQVAFVSPDISHDQQTNAPYFTVRIMLPDEERHRLAGLQLVSGMPAEVFMQTGSRTMFSYLFKPIFDQLQRAFVER